MPITLNNPVVLVLAGLTLMNLLLIVLLAWQFQKYRRRQGELFEGAELRNLEEVLLKQKKTLGIHNKNLKELGEILEELVGQNKFNICKVGLVRFNPFANDGGNLSFSLTLLDGYDTGVVVSSLHNREGTRIYAKQINRGSSNQHLTKEEQEAISQAKSNH